MFQEPGCSSMDFTRTAGAPLLDQKQSMFGERYSDSPSESDANEGLVGPMLVRELAGPMVLDDRLNIFSGGGNEVVEDTMDRLTEHRAIFESPAAQRPRHQDTRKVRVAAIGATNFVDPAGKSAAAIQQPYRDTITGLLPEVKVVDDVNQSLGALSSAFNRDATLSKPILRAKGF